MPNSALSMDSFVDLLNNSEEGILTKISQEFHITKDKAFEVWAVNLIEDLQDLKPRHLKHRSVNR